MGDNRFNLRRFVVVIVYFMLLLSFSGPTSRTLEQVASLPVPLVPPCGGLRRAAELKVLVLVLWYAAPREGSYASAA